VSFTVRVEGLERPVIVAMGDTILESALAQDLPYPHGCRSGNCGACKSELIDGDVDLLPYSEFALSDAERHDGKILACRAVPWSDCTVRYLEQDEVVMHPQRRLTCRVASVERATHDVVVLRLETVAGGPFDFSPGQYASLQFGGLPARDFSMAGLPADPLLEFHIRRLPGGVASAYVADQIRAGELVLATGPFGGAYLRERHAGPILLAAGGTGLAPMLSIARASVRTTPERPLRFYFGVRDEPDVYGLAALDSIVAAGRDVAVTVALSEPRGGVGRRRGYLADVLRADVREVGGCKAYLAGPPVMVDSCSAVLEASGIAHRDIHGDAFFPAATTLTP
jgi:ferredoxin-NAD(P)+ reductase (naphthalene dioxygenase ferredoxin-specific)